MKKFSLLGATAFEWYTLAAYGVMSPVFSKVISQGNSVETIAMVVSVTFMVGFLVRPLGAWLFGSLANSYGRKRILIIVSILLAILSVLVGFLPNSPKLFSMIVMSFFAIRLIQGFVASSISPLTAAYLYESAEELKSAEACWTSFASVVGSFIAIAVGLVLYTSLSQQQMLEFGWRIPFWLGGLTIVWSFLMMKYLDEPAIEDEGQSDEDQGSVMAAVVKIFFYGALGATGGVLIGNMIQFLTSAVSMKFQLSLWMVFASALAMVVLSPIVLRFIKTYSPLTVSFVGSLMVLLFSSLLFDRILGDSAIMSMVSIIILNALFLMYVMPLPGLFASMFNRNGRAIYPGVIYGLCLGVFGSTIPLETHFVAQALSHPDLASFILTCVAFVSLVAGFFMTRSLNQMRP